MTLPLTNQSWIAHSLSLPALARKTIDAKLPKSSRLAKLYGRPVAWSIELDGFNERIYLADFDNDGLAELMFVDFEGRRVLFYDGSPSNGYALAGIEAIDGWPQQDVIIQDFNADGHVDIVIPGGSSRTTMLMNRGGWQFEYGLFRIRWAAASAVRFDLNDDGGAGHRLRHNKEIEAYINNRDGTLGMAGRPMPLAAGHMVAADLTGDAVLELVASPYFPWNEPPDEFEITVVTLPSSEVAAVQTRTLNYTEAIWRLIPFTPAPGRAGGPTYHAAKHRRVHPPHQRWFGCLYAALVR